MREILKYTNSNGQSVDLSTLSSYHVNVSHDVSGLSDVQNEIYSKSSMAQDGDTYISGRIIARDVEILGHINTQNREQRRQYRRKLVKIFNPQLSGTLTYTCGDFVRKINCYPDCAPSFEADGVLYAFTLSLVCLDPFWRDLTETRDEIAAWIGSLEFPVELSTDWEIGYRQESLIVNCINEGDVRCGLRVKFSALGTLTNPSILNVSTQEIIKLNTTMAAGDVITVNTNYGQKSAALLSGGVTTNIFSLIDVSSTWLQLYIGDNLLRYDADDGLENLEVTVYHNNRYLGV